jgi:hypothetical protein
MPCAKQNVCMNSTRFTRIAPSYVAEEKSVFTTLLPIIHDHGALSKRLSGIGKNRPKIGLSPCGEPKIPVSRQSHKRAIYYIHLSAGTVNWRWNYLFSLLMSKYLEEERHASHV